MINSELQLSLRQIIELNLAISGDDNHPGIVDRDLTMIERFWLNDLNDKLNHISGAVLNLRDDTIRRRGKPDSDGNIVIKATENIEIEFEGTIKNVTVYTQEFLDFQKEYNELMKEIYVIRINPSIKEFVMELLAGKKLID